MSSSNAAHGEPPSFSSVDPAGSGQIGCPSRRDGSGGRLFPDAADLLEDDTLRAEPALELGGSQADYLAVARSVADKFLIRCLLDDVLRPLYTNAGELMRLKSQQAEVLFAALRFGPSAPAPCISLEAHKELSEEHVGRLKAHLEAAAREHALLAEGSSRLADAQELVRRFEQVPGLPMGLLPVAEQGETEHQAAAMARKGGGGSPGKRVLGLELAPLRVPIKRRRQMFGCFVICSVLPCSLVVTGLLLFWWRRTWPFLLSYLPYALLLDRAPWSGGSTPWPSLRRCWIFKQFSEYFPASLIKANPGADFSGCRPMLMGYHPHGIFSFGCACSFGTDTTGWPEKFPGLTPRVATLDLNMRLPFLREVLKRTGFIATSRGAVKKALRPGNVVIVVVGGAAEALDTKPGEYVLTLKRRTGFFRLALEHGADLVPSFGFGENDIFETIKESDSMLYRIQQWLYKRLTFSTPVFYGRNVFTYNYGFLPFRRPLTVVVGEPIRVEKSEHPNPDEVEALRSTYITALRKLFEEWRPRLEPGRETPLIIL